MANSPLVSLRIPAETLERIDKLAESLYPSRRTGRNPNRSQVILDALEKFLAQQESTATHSDNLSQFDNEITQVLQEYSKQLEPHIKEYIDNKFLAYAYNLEHRLHALERQLHTNRSGSIKEAAKSRIGKSISDFPTSLGK